MLTTADTMHAECPACGHLAAAEELAESDACLECLDDADQIAEAEHALDWARDGDLDLQF